MAPHTHTPPSGSHHQPHRPHHHPQHQHGLGGVRPAVPEMNRRRGNSVIIPAIPPMPQFQHIQQQQIQHHQYLQHQQPYYPVHSYAHPHLQHHPPQVHSRIPRQPHHAPQPQPPPLPPPPPPPPPVTHQVEEFTPQSPSSTLSGLSLPPRPDSQATLVEEPLEPPSRPFFRPPLPWYSAPGPFPPRRRKVRKPAPPATPPALEPEKPSATTSVSGIVTPVVSAPPSEVDSTHPTTPASSVAPSVVTTVRSKAAQSSPRTSPAVPSTPPKPRSQPPTAPAVPLVPAVPIVPATKPVPKEGESEGVASLDGASQSSQPAPKEYEKQGAEKQSGETTESPEKPVEKPAEKPKFPSWADMFKKDQPKAPVNGQAGVKTVNGNHGSLDETLRTFNITHTDAINAPFLEPRGLINTGNMCFMNAILQMLLFCGPFYHFIERVSTGAKRFKDNTPLIEMMIMFAREFRVITKDPSAKIKSDDLEAFGESFAPEFVYETIRQLKRFSHMRRGHQQDAEEFLGFLLDGLHEEAVEIMSKNSSKSVITNGVDVNEKENGWMEVGHKQKSATTRTTETPESPISKIFGGKFRSEFRVPGLSPSITTEPYTPLQLDIQAPDVMSVSDALKHLTIPEKIQGDFNSPKGANVTATKQVHIDTLPPVLILHLKRFQYDNTGGVQKIWKKIAYPLELEIPSEAMSPRKRQTQRPKYRLIGVVYHHGSSAQGGHYTVDVLRQDAKSWLRFDDTVLKRVSSAQVIVDVKEFGRETESELSWGPANGAAKKEDKQAYILFYQRI